MKNDTNIRKYKVLSRFYDKVFSRILAKGRSKALSLIDFNKNDRVLLVGAGTGLDIPFIPQFREIVGIDLSTSMLELAKRKYKSEKIDFKEMNAEVLRFEDSEFDIVILSLILSVVENPEKALKEALRVVNSNGKILIYDKFSEHKVSIGRRFLNKITSAVGTDITRSFITIAKDMDLVVHEDISVMYGDNYRAIVVSKLVRS